jgi:BirA family biotin operon repressor/biotin-[acetyl-CoA-carboxylase] ligase
LEEGSAPIFTAWTELCELTGKRVQVDCNNLLIEGKMVGLGGDGALLVRTSAGKIESIYAGDVLPL